ncbi:Os11g0208700 [Oryza sativa Japonica Group]|uniref:non-specific serine/threonine protein kinase n=1 Tax=Oryza sativa subsp. japonica TaxID=39947 RepID=Q0ITY0_ORYSJ|nr:Os11g0208700 [Oryza sativa Japonica Group]|eukprot:NP_001067472.2 Os11g0208700 [Oryza sativa Japonica Group]
MPPLHAYLGLLLLLLSMHTPSCYATNDTLAAGQLLAVGEKLISRNGKFALGFFKPTLPEDAGSKYKNIASPGWYLAIWFNEIPVCTTVWVANRERPITDHELNLAQLKFSQDGSSLAIIINRATESTVWSRQIANRTAQAKTSMNTSAILLDSGNLVIESLSDVYLWQSFDDATDLVLPGAKFGWNKVTGLHRTGISKKNLIDPGLGSYFVQLNERGFILWRRDPYIEYLTWSSVQLTNMLIPLHNSQLEMNSQTKGFLMPSYVNNDEEEYFMYHSSDELASSFVSIDMSGQLKLSIWSQVNQYWQEVYAHPTDPCALFAACGPFSFCIATCGPFGVCDGSRKPFCDCMEGFSPKSPQDWELMDRTAGCFRNTPLDCSSNRSSIDMFLAIGRGVLPTNHKRVEDATTQSKCEEACLRNCSCIAYAYEDSTCYAWRGELLNLRLQDSIESLSEDTLYLRLAAKDMPASTKNKRKPVPAAVTLIASITEKLGSGGFGSVFKGVLSDSTTIAVKRLDGDKRLLVYEHMINGSLDAHLFHSNGAVLDWSTRHQIAIGVARGLSYLHESCHECIIHCDIKPENILVEASFAPKIADCGMAAFVRRDFSRVLTTFRGTKGKLHEGSVQNLLDPELHGDFNLEEAERVCKVACWCIQENEIDRPTMAEVVRFLEGLQEIDMPPMPRLLAAIT